MILFSHLLPWILLVLGAAAFVEVRRRHRRALALTGVTLQRILQAVESTGDAIGIGDFEGNSLYHNRAHIALLGYTVEELNAVPGSGVLFADPAVAKAIIQAVFAGRSWIGEADLLTKNGRRIPASVRADIIRDEKGAPVGIFGVFRDITRERQLAEEAARATKLDSLGMMASGIAHDFSNLLTIMLGQIALAQMEPDLPPSQKSYLDEVMRAAGRGRDLTRQLKLFAKGETPEKSLIALAPVIREAAVFAVQGSEVRLNCRIPDDLPVVMADESQILQVVNNLALNAVQAMPKGGVLTVTGEVIAAKAGAVEADLKEGHWLRVSVADTGVGIPPENLARIFEPFFTTKPTGTGLGLAMCYSIAAKHGGHLRVESAVGRGTTFHLLLPVSDLVPAGAIPRTS